MTVTTYDDVDEFAAVVLPLLAGDEARHNLALGVVSGLVEGRLVPTAAPLLATVSDGERVVVVTHTPPYGLLLTDPLSADAAGAVVGTVLAGGWAPTTLVGPPEAAEPTIAAWCRRTGAAVRSRRRQGVYALRELVPPAGITGAARRATTADFGLVADWVSAFAAELDLATAMPRSQLEARVAAGDIVVWSGDGVPVSMAGIGARTPTGARIGPVYTPPAHRRRGYAAAATAAATRACLDEGAAWCFLYTDLDNPTSNSVYRRLGYRMVCESLEVTFAPP